MLVVVDLTYGLKGRIVCEPAKTAQCLPSQHSLTTLLTKDLPEVAIGKGLKYCVHQLMIDKKYLRTKAELLQSLFETPIFKLCVLGVQILIVI